eukprot:NODE_367_length_10044_cov_0.769432.p3 type:complete len:516 gc:universal NODE_367_length_10044_cov_0.769432:9770-8223(-)
MSQMSRESAFKQRSQFGADEVKKRREDATLQLRRQKREENLQKRRMIFEDKSNQEQVPHMDLGDDYHVIKQNLVQRHDEKVLLSTVVQIRRMLSKERNPPIDQIISAGIVPVLVQLLRSQNSVISFEAAWALTNIASGSSDQTNTVIESGAVPEFVNLLQSEYMDVKEQAVWALGNIAGDAPQCRDAVLACGAMMPLLQILTLESSKLSLVRNSTWTLSNFCRGKHPIAEWSCLAPALPVLKNLLSSSDEEILVDSLWSISYMSDGSNDRIEHVIKSGIIPRLIELLNHPNANVQTPALRSIGNIVTGSDMQTELVLSNNVLEPLYRLLSSNKASIKKETCWTISNITAGNANQIQKVIDAGMIPNLVQCLQHGDMKTKREACWALSNATTGGMQNPDQVDYLVSCGCIGPLLDMLTCMDIGIIQVCLDGLTNILKVGDLKGQTEGYFNPYVTIAEENNAYDKLSNLTHMNNNEIYKRANNLLDKYFQSENMAEQALNEDGTLSFGQPQQQKFTF